MGQYTTNSSIAVLNLPNIQTNHAGIYSLVMTNVIGGALNFQTNVAVVTVLP